jgi:trigger factor
VTEADIDAEVEIARKKNTRFQAVDRPAANGDTANIDYKGCVNGVAFEGGTDSDYDLVLGSGNFIPGFEEQVVGMTAGEEKDINVTFPEQYAPQLAGKDAVFTVKVNEVREAILPDLDDEFAKDVSEFDTLDEYKNSIRENLTKVRSERADADFRSEVMRQAAENITATIPESMIADKTEEILRNYAANFGMNSRDMSLDQLKQMMGVDDAMVNNTIRPGAEYQVRSDLLLEAVIEAENIETTEEENREYLAKVAESIGAKVEEVEKYFGMDYIAAEQKKEKATQLIVESAVAKVPEQA